LRSEAESGGYSSRPYVESLAEFGVPRRLGRSGGWLLERQIPNTRYRDLSGPYPLFSCADWSTIPADLADLPGAPVSVVVVVDPLTRPSEGELSRAFPHLTEPFKQHLIRDFGRPAPLPSHHRRHLRRASSSVDVELCADPVEHLDDWVGLYSRTLARPSVTNMAAFSRAAFAKQLRLPNLIAVRAVQSGTTVSMALWLMQGENAYYHLGASSDRGYSVSASYAVFAASLQELEKRGARFVNLGGAAGNAGPEDGLHRFKSGWTNASMPAYLCGRILDPPAYSELSERITNSTGWFPAYRSQRGILEEPAQGRG
jgi:hypothetical protein